MQVSKRIGLPSAIHSASEAVQLLLQRLETWTVVFKGQCPDGLRAAATKAAKASAPNQQPSTAALAWVQSEPALGPTTHKQRLAVPAAKVQARTPPWARAAAAAAAATAAAAAAHPAVACAGATASQRHRQARTTAKTGSSGGSAKTSTSDVMLAAELTHSMSHRQAADAEQRHTGSFDCSLCLSSLLDATVACCPWACVPP